MTRTNVGIGGRSCPDRHGHQPENESGPVRMGDNTFEVRVAGFSLATLGIGYRSKGLP
jgi:hypothetical protein